MNGKKTKLIRKAALELNLNSRLQGKIYRGLNKHQREVYGKDVKLLLELKHNKEVEQRWQNG